MVKNEKMTIKTKKIREKFSLLMIPPHICSLFLKIIKSSFEIRKQHTKNAHCIKQVADLFKVTIDTAIISTQTEGKNVSFYSPLHSVNENECIWQNGKSYSFMLDTFYIYDTWENMAYVALFVPFCWFSYHIWSYRPFELPSKNVSKGFLFIWSIIVKIPNISFGQVPINLTQYGYLWQYMLLKLFAVLLLWYGMVCMLLGVVQYTVWNINEIEANKIYFKLFLLEKFHLLILIPN